MIHVDDVTVVAGGAPRVRGVSFGVAAREVVGLVGPNGAGKSTLLSAITGDRPPTSGEIRLAGTPLPAWAPGDRARELVVLPQHPEAAFGLRACDVVALGLELVGRRADHALLAARLADVGLGDRARTPVRNLSGGERQRVHLARVLAQAEAAEGSIAVVLDEPTSAQDPGRVVVVLEALRRLRRRHAVLFVSHDLNAAAAVADRVGLLVDGRLVDVGPPELVLTAPGLEAAYGVPFEVSPSPGTGRPRIHPRFALEAS